MLLANSSFLFSEDKFFDSGVINIGTHSQKKQIEVPFDIVQELPRYVLTKNSIIYAKREYSPITKCLEDDFKHENCPIQEYKFRCTDGYDRYDGESEKVNVLLTSKGFCGKYEIKKNGLCYFDKNHDGLIDERDNGKPKISLTDYWVINAPSADGGWARHFKGKLAYRANMQFFWSIDDAHIGWRVYDMGIYGKEILKNAFVQMPKREYDKSLGIPPSSNCHSYMCITTGKAANWKKLDFSPMGGQSNRIESNSFLVAGDNIEMFLRDGGHGIGWMYMRANIYSPSSLSPNPSATPKNPIYEYTFNGNRNYQLSIERRVGIYTYKADKNHILKVPFRKGTYYLGIANNYYNDIKLCVRYSFAKGQHSNWKCEIPSRNQLVSINIPDSIENGDYIDFKILSSSLATRGFKLCQRYNKRSGLQIMNHWNCSSAGQTNRIYLTSSSNEYFGVSLALVNGNKQKVTTIRCPDGYKKVGTDSCQKNYTYYNYSCKDEINEFGYNYQPLNIGGFPYTNPNPPKNNCVRLRTICPVDNSITCSKTLLSNKIKVFLPYDGESVKRETVDYPKNKVFYEYTCKRKDYYPKNKGGINYTNPHPPKNNCVYRGMSPDYSEKKFYKLPSFNNEGSFKGDMYGRVVKDLVCSKNSTNNKCTFQINEIKADGNKICFKDIAGSNEECITIDDKCSFSGDIKAKSAITFLETNDENNKIIAYDYNNNIIGSIDLNSSDSKCKIEGKVGQMHSNSGITAVKAYKNSLLFWDTYNRGFIGAINFIPSIPKSVFDDGYDFPEGTEITKMLNKGFISFYTFDNSTIAVYKKLITTTECKNLIQDSKYTLFYPANNNEENYKNISLSYENYNGVSQNNSRLRSCVIVKRGIAESFNDIEYLEKIIEHKNADIGFFCSPLKCVNHECQYNKCPKGYKGNVLKSDDLSTAKDNKDCINNQCDSNKAYWSVCGKVGGCDNTDGNVVQDSNTLKCYKAVCDKGETYNPSTNACEKESCKGTIKDNRCYLESY